MEEKVLEMLIASAFTGILIGGVVVYLLLSYTKYKEQETTRKQEMTRTAPVLPPPPSAEEAIDVIASRLQKWHGVEYHISYTNILWDGKSEMTEDPEEYERSFSKKYVD